MAGGGFSLGSGKEYPGKLTSYVRFSCIVASLGGLIVGYDLGIIGGVTSMDPFLKKFFPQISTKKISLKPSNDQYCQLQSRILDLYTSLIYIGAYFSSMTASTYSKRLDMILGSSFCTVGAIFNCFAVNGFMITIGRFYIGWGIGCAIHSVPIYVSEMALFKYQGAFNIMFQLSITIGMLVARLLNYFTAKIDGDWGWRISLGGSVVPSLIFFFSFIFLSESPYALLQFGKINEAKAQLRKIRGINNVDVEFNDLAEAINTANLIEYRWREIVRNNKYRPQLILAMLTYLCQQLAGINVIYAPLLFKSMGFDDNSSVMSALITTIVYFGATLIAIGTFDRYDRKRGIFFLGSLQMLLGQVMMTISVASQSGTSASQLPIWFSIIVVISMCIYVAGFAYSWGPLGLLVPTEILPLEVRSTGQSFMLIHSTMFAYYIVNFLPDMLCYLKFGFFIIFTVFVGVISIFIFKLLPREKMHNRDCVLVLYRSCQVHDNKG